MDPRLCAPLLLWTSLLGCGTPPPPPAITHAPQPIAVDIPRVRGKVFHEIVFTPARSYPGLELKYVLRDEAGHTIKVDKLQLGQIFDENKPLVAGQQVVHLIVRPEDLIKVSGKPRPRSALDPPPLPLDQIHTAELWGVWPCRQQEWEWQPGRELPPELHVQRMPEPGTIFLRNVCPRSRPLREPTLRQSFRFRRRPDLAHAWVDLKITYNLDHPAGVTYNVLLLDQQGQSVLRPGCTLQLRQPAVLAGTVSDYSIEFSGKNGVQRAHRVTAARITDVKQGANAHQPAVDQICK